MEARAWAERFMPRGPIGLLLLASSHFGVAVDNDLYIRQHGHTNFSVMQAPYQALGTLLRQRVFNHRARACRANRSELMGLATVDLSLLRDSFVHKKKSPEDGIRRWFVTLSSVNNSILHAYDQHGDGRCRCGASGQSFSHLLIHCPKTRHLREVNPVFAKLPWADLPAGLHMGIPQMADANPSNELWGTNGTSYLKDLADLFGIEAPDDFTMSSAVRAYSEHASTSTGPASCFFRQPQRPFW